MSRVTVDWPDLGYTCVASVLTRSSLDDRPIMIEWKLYTLYDEVRTNGVPEHREWQRAGSDFSPDPVDSLDEAEIFAEGATKWDGCINWEFKNDGLMLHECDRQGLINLGILLARVHDLCGGMMPSADYTPEPLPEGYRLEEATQ